MCLYDDNAYSQQMKTFTDTGQRNSSKITDIFPVLFMFLLFEKSKMTEIMNALI